MAEESFEPVHAQNVLIGVPLCILAIGLGVRIIANEMDRRTLEIAYTVPGGCHRIWLAKMMASIMILLLSECLLAMITYVVFTPFPVSALYGAFQATFFYLVSAMALAALCKSEITGAMVSTVLISLNGLLTGFGGLQSRVSPFFNSLALRESANLDVTAYLVQNRIGFVLIVAGITALAFSRAENREKLLS